MDRAEASSSSLLAPLIYPLSMSQHIRAALVASDVPIQSPAGGFNVMADQCIVIWRVQGYLWSHHKVLELYANNQCVLLSFHTYSIFMFYRWSQNVKLNGYCKYSFRYMYIYFNNNKKHLLIRPNICVCNCSELNFVSPFFNHANVGWETVGCQPDVCVRSHLLEANVQTNDFLMSR